MNTSKVEAASKSIADKVRLIKIYEERNEVLKKALKDGFYESGYYEYGIRIRLTRDSKWVDIPLTAFTDKEYMKFTINQQLALNLGYLNNRKTELNELSQQLKDLTK